MKKFILPIMTIVLYFVLSGCEKVIDVDLEDQESKLIIEAKLIKIDQKLTVDISKTSPYFESSETETISDAQIVLTDPSGTSYLVPHYQNGHYELSIDASVNTQYSISVLVDGIYYQATSYMPSHIPLDALETEYQLATPATDEGYGVYLRFQDPEEANFYRVKHAVNGIDQLDGSDYQVISDEIGNGNYFRLPMFQEVFNSGEKIFVELIHFDEVSYDYFNSLGDILGGQQGPNQGSAAPGNPITNWNGDVGGYFSAYTSDTLSVVIP